MNLAAAIGPEYAGLASKNAPCRASCLPEPSSNRSSRLSQTSCSWPEDAGRVLLSGTCRHSLSTVACGPVGCGGLSSANRSMCPVSRMGMHGHKSTTHATPGTGIQRGLIV